MKELTTQILAIAGAVAIGCIIVILIASVIEWFKRRELNRQMLTDSRNDHESRIIDLEVAVRGLKQLEQARCEEENEARKGTNL